jgi:hypothetical protein
VSDKEILVVFLLFYGTGYTKNCSNHEAFSIVIASDFLSEMGKCEDYIEKVAGLIKVTEIQYVPQSLAEKIIKDADYCHMLRDYYILICEGLRNEKIV